MTQAHEELAHRLAALRSDFAALGARAGGAAQALTASLPPSAALLEELAAARTAFADLRRALLEQAGALSLVLDAEGLGTLRDLEPVLAAIATAQERRRQLAAWTAAREEALGLLDRVMALVHREEAAFAPLADCQARARELHGALAAANPDDPDNETATLSGLLNPYADLLALVEGWNALDDERCAVLQDAITQAFGRALGLAALRGKLGRQGEQRPAPPPPPRRRRPEPAVPVAVKAEPPEASGLTVAPPPPAAPAPEPAAASPPAAVEPAAAAPAAPEPALVGADEREASVSSLVVEIRLSGDRVSVETPEAQHERRERLERLARDTAPWWTAAREGWQALRERGLSLAEAAREHLGRFPHLLSVPLPASAATPAGPRLAEGYALLLAHIEKQEAGFVTEALSRLNPQLSTGAGDEPYPLGQELYLYVVAEGRLYKTYPDFVRDVIQHTVPAPGPWVQGGIVESDDETRLFSRGEEPGNTEERSRTLTERRERLGPHVFRVTLGPLTTRFFTLQLAGPGLEDPPDVEIRLLDNEAPSAHAWLVPLPLTGRGSAPAPRKHRTGGTTLPGLGQELGGLWIGVFNADPSNDHRYDLALTLRRKPAAAAAGQTATPATSQFFGRKR